MDKEYNRGLDTPQPQSDPDAGSPLAERQERGSGRRLRGAVVHYLGTAILSGRIAPGERLTGEVANAEALNVSRSAYREAVKVLTAKGLIESKPKAGTRVLPRDRWNLLDPTVLAWALESEPNPDFVRDLFELRVILEPAAAALAARRRTRDDVKAMRNALSRMRRHTLSTEAGRNADRDFHDSIMRAAHNEVMATLSASICAAVSWTTVFKQRQKALPRDPVADHVRVFDAIAAGDSTEAHQAMTLLIKQALEHTHAAIEIARFTG